MKLRKRCLAVLTALTMVIPLGLGGCGKSKKDTTETTTENVSTDTDSNVDTENYIELALNVFYNDEEHNYYDREDGESIIVTEEGQYTLTFDCSKDLSEAAINAGVTSLNNLTAIYILDMGSTKDAQSPIKGCNIRYDSVVVDGTELTITKPDFKSALKGNGIFDTNDPINSWDGSAVEEVANTGEHVANFTTLDKPTTVSVTFTLSDMDWEGTSQSGGNDVEVSANTYVNSAKFSDIDFTSMDAIEFTKYLGNGINLGNTMEAFNTAYGKNLDVSKYETAWGQPVTTEEMIVGMKNCGFDTIRIPVAWTNMMDYENGDYTINTAYVDRVEEIVNWALDAEMFVIINDHYDHGWWDLFAGDEAEREQAWKIYESIWTQLCERFGDYSDMLIFESANEELGHSWLTQGIEEDETYEIMNEINQKFVDIVRASGGNNDDRFLLIAGNNTNIDYTADDRFVMPKDSATGKLMISVHYYDPWNYCCDKSLDSVDYVEGYRWGLIEEYEYMNNQVSKMKKFTDAGYGVIIGEYGALPAYIDNAHYQIPNTIEYTDYFLDVCDVNNFCPVLWSTGSLYDKSTLNMLSNELTELYTSRCFAEEEAAGDGYIDTVKANMAEAEAAAPDHWEGIVTYAPGTPVAWIMWNGGAGTYSVGDKYNPADNTMGITAHDVVLDGPGEYTVSLDFAGTNDGITFAALGLADGELLYPNAILDIKEITVDGKVIEQVADDYTSSDDEKCTRVNLYNIWVNEPPEDARNIEGDLTNASPVILDPADVTGIKNITITFELVVE